VATTEVLLMNGERYEVEGEPGDVETVIVGAARGSIMALAWLTEANSGNQVAVNPEHVVALRGASSG
jgi:hypothetical protein